MTQSRPPRPGDATLTVTRAATLLGVHPNTIRAWSDQGRLRYYRINERGDRRYRMADLQRFLAAAAAEEVAGAAPPAPPRRRDARHAPSAAAAAADAQEPARALGLVAELAEIAAHVVDLDVALADACARIRTGTGATLVGIWERRPGGLVTRAVDGLPVTTTQALRPDAAGVAAVLGAPDVVRTRAPGDPAPGLGLGTDETLVAIPGPHGPWGVLVVAGAPGLAAGGLPTAIARLLGVLVREHDASEAATAALRRSEALRRVSTDLASRLEARDVIGDLADHARVLFGADRVLVLLGGDGGRPEEPAATGFSSAYVGLVRELEGARFAAGEIPSRRPVVVLGPGERPGTGPLRAAAVQEGLATLLVVPLLEGAELHGVMHLGHDTPQPWRDADLAAVETLAGDAAVAVRSARAFDRMATWAAQLQSIQALGSRLSGLSHVDDIAHAIATEISTVIDVDNVRVYRQAGDELVPVALRGQVARYLDETPERVRVRVGEGLAGWVALHRVPQVVDDAAADPRTALVPGTDPDAAESMLLAPMVQEDACLGVVALSRLGRGRFSEDDLRLLAIYAAFAAQAVANAEATERLRGQSGALERQLRAQRELLQITESILATLEPRAVLEQIADRLGALIRSQKVTIQVVEQPGGTLVPLAARGGDGTGRRESGIAAWVLERNQPVLVRDRRADPRFAHLRGVPAADGSMIAVPLVAEGRATGVLTLERSGDEPRFDDQDFELVQLFAAHVSIALRNAEVFSAAEVRARTDDLTGLLNHGTFKDRLARAAAAMEPFSVVMIDLDRFKDVNDALGHQAGDRLLREIAQAILGAARDSDDVFRYGGDEFAVLLPRTEEAGVAAVAHRIRAAIDDVGGPASPWASGGLDVAASIGYASYPADGSSDEEILLAADRACFVAKRTGRGRVASAAEGLAIAAEFTLSVPTPVDAPSADGG